MFAEWTGGAWHSHPIVNAGARLGHYAPGISLDHENPSVVVLSRKVSERCVVERWRTADRGATWHHRKVNTGSAPGDSLRPIAPRGAPSERDVVWMQGRYLGYTDYRTDIAGHFSR
jgi:hypothetical protein